MLEELKGIGRRLMTCYDGRGAIELRCYADESWAITRDGRTIGVWEPDRVEECLLEFGRLIGLDKGGQPLRAMLLTDKVKGELIREICSSN
jgi:hypothetical protein